MCQAQSPNSSHPLPSSLVSIYLFSTSVSFSALPIYVIKFCDDYMAWAFVISNLFYVIIKTISVFLWLSFEASFSPWESQCMEGDHAHPPGGPLGDGLMVAQAANRELEQLPTVCPCYGAQVLDGTCRDLQDWPHLLPGSGPPFYSFASETP